MALMLRIMINIKIINQTYGLITFLVTLPEVSAKKNTTKTRICRNVLLGV